MDRDEELKLITECLELTQANRPVMTAEETLVPVAKYRDQALFERERRILFRRSANVIAHGSQIAQPGDFITRDVVGTPVLLVRDEDRAARAFVNVCSHRGATVELREQGRCRRFVCPYHAWTYKTDGSLANVRHRQGFPSLDGTDAGLVELPCLERAGFVWVCPDPGVRESSPDMHTEVLLAELEQIGCAQSAVFDSETRVWKANWKLIVDGGLESYHFRVAHRDTIASFFTDSISTFQPMGDHIRTILPRLSIVELAERPRSDWDIRKHAHLLYTVYPNAMILVQERHFELILLTPLALDQTRIEIATIVPDPGPAGHSEKDNRFWAANHAFTKATLTEDFEIAEQIQTGVSSGVQEFFRFARFEGALSQWHRRTDAKLGCDIDDFGGQGCRR
ncbi:aromatic ring-hydroxylating oxygenase subunit alpha [Mycobacterium spongiae]|uniref:Rieske 2Fe-2S domain-containing protein n=1 Tax=Mycobacterium spongiae TaxID=886343 RepID=A0A975JWS6_9MYCO|nr:SRPBCC family protein [Mycobacterium spongiae]QUR67131.1 Rieske 2Fe-2S domain-containing protein [Mycobacterium spongiae]